MALRNTSIIDNNSDHSNASSVRSVSFSTIEFRMHNVVLSDNPSTSTGPAVELGWDVQDSFLEDIDIFEFNRDPRRSRKHLQMSRMMREYVLISGGYSKEDIQEHLETLEKERQDFKTKRRFPNKIFNKTKNTVAKLIHLK